jgi:HEAT repeat protein
VSSVAASILGELGLEPDIAIPALIACLKSPDEYLRESGADALAKFGDKARCAVPFLFNALRDRDSGVRDSATGALQKIAPEMLGTNVAGAGHE